MLRTFISAGLTLILSCTCASAGAFTIKANELALGTDVTLLGNLGEVSFFSGNTKKTATINYDTESGLNTIGTHTGNFDEITGCNFVCGTPPQSTRGLLIELNKQIDSFSFKGFDRSSDGFQIQFYDSNDLLIRYTNSGGTSISYYGECGVGNPCKQYNADYETDFDLSNVKKIRFGGSSAGAYVTEISVKVPEPNTLILLLLGLPFIQLSRKLRHINQP